MLNFGLEVITAIHGREKEKRAAIERMRWQAFLMLSAVTLLTPGGDMRETADVKGAAEKLVDDYLAALDADSVPTVDAIFDEFEETGDGDGPDPGRFGTTLAPA